MNYEDGEDVPSQTLSPYPAGTLWTFTGRPRGRTQTVELALYAEPDGSSLSDGYLPDEITAEALWRLWTDQAADQHHKDHPEQFHPGEVPIHWSVTLPGIKGVFEAAPHRPARLTTSGLLDADFEREDFLTHYSHPVHAETGERVNWLRLPVIDLGWNASATHKGGFIQQATGWKPSALQPTMDVRQIGAAAGLYVPPPR
ncbi:hypothetical protein ACWCPT_29445 [Streptomyces sp. NPDC002308]